MTELFSLFSSSLYFFFFISTLFYIFSSSFFPPLISPSFLCRLLFFSSYPSPPQHIILHHIISYLSYTNLINPVLTDSNFPYPTLPYRTPTLPYPKPPSPTSTSLIILSCPPYPILSYPLLSFPTINLYLLRGPFKFHSFSPLLPSQPHKILSTFSFYPFSTRPDPTLPYLTVSLCTPPYPTHPVPKSNFRETTDDHLLPGVPFGFFGAVYASQSQDGRLSRF